MISTDPKFKNDNARFTPVPWKAFSNLAFFRYQCFCPTKLLILFCNGEQWRAYLKWTPFESENDCIFHILNKIKTYKGYCCKSDIAMYLCMEGYLKLRLRTLTSTNKQNSKAYTGLTAKKFKVPCRLKAIYRCESAMLFYY